MIVRVHIRVFDRRGQRRKDDKFMEYYHSEICPIEIVKTEKLNITFQRHNHVFDRQRPHLPAFLRGQVGRYFPGHARHSFRAAVLGMIDIFILITQNITGMQRFFTFGCSRIIFVSQYGTVDFPQIGFP